MEGRTHMENEQEGINLEAVNSEQEDSITLPGVEEFSDAEQNDVKEEPHVETTPVDEDKENLKKGVN